MLPQVLFVVALACSIMATTRDQYCSLCTDHTMCLFSGIGSKCKQGNYIRGVDSGNQNIIVGMHNTLRNKVAMGQETRGSNGAQPSASNMKKMVWDTELADVAQRWADQCDYKHDTCRNIPRFWWVGQNIAISWVFPCTTLSRTPDWTGSINSWYNEVSLFDKSIVPKFRSTTAETGHYTQVVWAETNTIGCGYTAFLDGNKCSQYYVCNYGVGGNVLDQPVYKVGTPRGSCPNSALDSTYPGLC